MPPAYRELARARCNESHPRYLQPEHFGYDFREWVSPYTKTAHALGGVAIVLQDWASADALIGGVDDDIQNYGRNPALSTNRRLDTLVQRVFGLTIQEVFVTNAFPLVKPGGMSASLPLRDVTHCVSRFAKHELEIVRPKIVLALRAVPFRALSECGVRAIRLPHPAARIGTVDIHEKI